MSDTNTVQTYNTKQFLDKPGLTNLWEKICGVFNEICAKINGHTHTAVTDSAGGIGMSYDKGILQLRPTVYTSGVLNISVFGPHTHNVTISPIQPENTNN